ESVHGSDDLWLSRVVAKRLAQLRDLVRHARVRNECAGPQALVDLFLGNGIGPMRDQDVEQRKGFWRQLQRAAAPRDLSSPRVEDAVAEGEAHSRHHGRNREKALSNREDFPPR